MTDLTPRAQKLWARIQAGAFIPAFGASVPKAMVELERAGLVMTMGRVARVVACWVPIGTEPLVIERFPCTHIVLAQPTTMGAIDGIELCKQCGEWMPGPQTLVMDSAVYEILKDAAKP